MSASIHPLADVQSNKIGEGTRVWQFVVILPEARVGNDCNICAQVFIENDVIVGDRVTIENGVQLWDGLRIEKDVFIGPNVTFTNDRFPRSRVYPEQYAVTTVKAGASIGGGGGHPSWGHGWRVGNDRGRCCRHRRRSYASHHGRQSCAHRRCGGGLQ